MYSSSHFYEAGIQERFCGQFLCGVPDEMSGGVAVICQLFHTGGSSSRTINSGQRKIFCNLAPDGITHHFPRIPLVIGAVMI
jgi:hypothetical protein